MLLLLSGVGKSEQDEESSYINNKLGTLKDYTDVKKKEFSFTDTSK